MIKIIIDYIKVFFWVLKEDIIKEDRIEDIKNKAILKNKQKRKRRNKEKKKVILRANKK